MSTMMMKFRFLDPILASKFDSDPMASALFYLADFETTSEGRTIVVRKDIMQELRKGLLTMMTFQSFDDKEYLPKLIASASFFAEAASRTENEDVTVSNDSANRIENATEIRTSEDVRRLLQQFCEGDDLLIWIQTSPDAILPTGSSISSSTSGSGGNPTSLSQEQENNDPNKNHTAHTSAPSKSKKAVSSSLRAIAKAGNRKVRKPKVSKTMDPQKDYSSELQQKKFPRSPGNDRKGIPVNRIWIPPGFSYSSNFCDAILGIPPYCSDATDTTIATSSEVTESSISSNYSIDVSFEINDGNASNTQVDDDIETRRILALAGCGFDDFYSDHQGDDFLSALFVSNDNNGSKNEVNHQQIGVIAANNHLLPSFFETKTSVSSVSIPMANNNSVSASLPRKDTIFFESSSLLQGLELEMAAVLESVVGSILLPEDGDSVSVRVDAKYSRPPKIIARYPCPTPKELLSMTWDQ